MKRCLSLVLCAVFAFALSLNVSALSLDKYNFNINIENGYQILTEDNISGESDLVESLGFSTNSMKQYFKDNSFILFAVNEQRTRQIQATCIETEFSRQIIDISNIGEDDAMGFVSRFITADNVSAVELVTMGDMVFYRAFSADKDSGGEFCTIQYITVRGGKLYTIGFFESSAVLSSEFKTFAEETMATLSIPNASSAGVGAKNVAEMILIIVLLLAAIVGAVIVIISLVRDFKRYEDDERPLFIRRRKK